jgi:mRNA-degrading endonuclease toxin of MazEF toxin-antitoxin module
MLRHTPSEVLLVAGDHGLTRDSAANCNNLMTIGRSNLLNYISHCEVNTMNAIAEAIHNALELEW